MLTDLNSNSLNLTEAESKIFNSRQVGLAIADLNDKESRAAVTGIIFKVSVICGCQLPTHDAHINALESEFLIFVNEFGYSKLTVEEILMAFRMNANFQLGDKVETYGAVFNIDYASKILKLYCDKRYRLDHKLIEADRHIQAEKKFAEEANARRIKIKNAYKKYWEDDNADIDYTDFYMQLLDDSAFANVRPFELFMEKAEKEKLEPETGDEHMGRFIQRTYSYMRKFEVEFAAQKLCVKYLFKNMKLTNKNEVYNDSLELMWPGFTIPDKRIEIELKHDVQPDF